ncbi:MAG TPA: hypothetical protein ENI82_01285 [Bacteroidetes bacterium]|nr:hypothetical protein [Bacteroidota bacterium]
MSILQEIKVEKIIEVASYPKCGNTWLRYILAGIFDIDIHKGIPDIHQQGEKTRDLIQIIKLRSEFGFYKSHILDHPSMNPDYIICIYRHPLDVFFSSLNYFKITGSREQFINGILKNVEEIYRDGELSIYLDEFNESLGSSYYNKMLGAMSNYKLYIEAAFDNLKVITVRYEDLIDAPYETIMTLLSSVFPNVKIEFDNSLFSDVDLKTKKSGDPFFWKAKKETYKDYLTEKEIYKFEQKWSSLLGKMKYL